MIISHDQFRIVVFVSMCMSVAVTEIVRSGSVALMGGVYL